MVRFQSPQSHRNPFRRSGSLARDRSANRRLFRMILALGLVLIVMQRAGDPKVYRMFFPELQQTTAVQDELLAPSDSVSSDRSDSVDATSRRADRIDDLTEDAALLESVNTGALWTKADQPAFYRLLSTGGEMKQLAKPPQQTGALSLLTQADVYLKSNVLIIGRLGRVEQIAAEANDFGVTKYYQLWIDPSDASGQPVTCYCERLMPSLKPYLGQTLIDDGPTVHVEGVYLKRIAYAAKAGSQLAPAIVGRITAGPAAVSSGSKSTSLKSTSTAALPMGWKWLVLSAASVALMITFVIFRISAASAKRIRIARQQSQRLDADALGVLQIDQTADSLSMQHEET